VKYWMHNAFLTFKGEKISKSKDGNKFSPMEIISRFSADCVRYWACSGTLGTDIAFDETGIGNNSRLLTKLWNSTRFAFQFLEGYKPDATSVKLQPVDKWILGRFNKVTEFYHRSFERYEFFPARNELEQFFWGIFCDNYLEYIKDRLYNPATRGEASTEAAKFTLYHLLLGQLKLFSPYVPHITEEIYQNCFRSTEGDTSIHISSFPAVNKEFNNADADKAGDLLVDLVTLVRMFKSKHNFSMKLPIDSLSVVCADACAEQILLVADDVKAVTKTAEIKFIEENELTELLEDRTDDLQISVKVNEAALFRNDLVADLKPVITSLKKELGLKSKSPVDTVYVQASTEFLPVLQEEPEQVIAAARADKVEFNTADIAYSATSREGLAVAIQEKVP